MARSLICRALSSPEMYRTRSSLAEEFADLQQQGGFTDSRLTAEHDHRPLDNAAAQNPIQLGKVGMEPVLLR